MCTALKTNKTHKDSLSKKRDQKVAREVLLNIASKLDTYKPLECTSVPKKLVVNL